jgi:hypothetical protein
LTFLTSLLEVTLGLVALALGLQVLVASGVAQPLLALTLQLQ